MGGGERGGEIVENLKIGDNINYREEKAAKQKKADLYQNFKITL